MNAQLQHLVQQTQRALGGLLFDPRSPLCRQRAVRLFGRLESLAPESDVVQQLLRRVPPLPTHKQPAKTIFQPPKPSTQRWRLEGAVVTALQSNLGARELLVEMIKRAVADLALYRGHKDPLLRALAAHAKVWLFEEEPGHPHWLLRAAEGKHLTSLRSVCDALDIQISDIRNHARKTKAADVRNTGRPVQQRRLNTDY